MRNPGVIDFQDALRGPVGYDLVSLLKDCYISWPRERVVRWVSGYRRCLRERRRRCRRRAMRSSCAGSISSACSGTSRCSASSARLWYRDGKAGYLADLPLTLEYVRDACARYPELAACASFLEERVAPGLPLPTRGRPRRTAPRTGQS